MRAPNRSEKILIGLTVAVVILATGLGAIIFFGTREFACRNWLPEIQEPEATPQFSTRAGLENATAFTTALAVTTTATAAPEELPPQAVAQRLLETMTLKEKAGQLLLARCPGEDPALLADYPVGGYLLFAVDFADKNETQVREMLRAFNEMSEIPMFFAVDEEGGTVVRVSANPELRETPFPAPRALFEAGGLEAVRDDAREKSDLLLSLGLNVNLAPVADVSQNSEDFIYPRTTGEDTATAADYVTVVVEAMADAGCGSCLKHFPGYGDNADTHTEVARDARSMETFLTADFLPFEAGIEAGASMVMVAHNVVEAMDPDLPASLSSRVHEILREDLGFDGVIVTDDLAMEGVGAYVGELPLPVLALRAGNDLLCVSDIAATYETILDAVASGELTEDIIDAAVLRVLTLKVELGLIDMAEN